MPIAKPIMVIIRVTKKDSSKACPTRDATPRDTPMNDSQPDGQGGGHCAAEYNQQDD